MFKNKYKLLVAATIISFQTLAAPIQFEDTSDELGFTRGTETWGIAWGNLNKDKYPDLWNSAHRDFPRLYQNNGSGGFDDVTMLYDRSMNGYWLNDTQFDVHGGAWGDYDNDGDDDLIVGAEKELFINQATSGGYFIKSTISSYRQWAVWNNTDSDRELESDLTCPISRDSNYMLLFDLDNNGDTEKICGATFSFPDQVIGASSSLVPSINLSNDAAIGDFNNDLRTDIIVTRGAVRPNGASKIDSNRIEAWFRKGPATKFKFSAPGEVTFLIDGQTGGVYREADKFVLDTNGGTSASARRVSISYQSGFWEVSFTGRGQAYVRITAQNPVSEPVMEGLDDADNPQATYHGVNKPSGIDWVFNTGLNQPRSCVSVVAADFDNDMDLDLYMACRTSVANVSNRYFDNDGYGSFTEVHSHGGEGPVGAGTEFGVADSVVTADYDVDGFMDLAVSNGLLYFPVSLGGPDTLIRNKGNGNHWVELDLIGTISPRAAIGAKVYITAGGVTQLREQSGGYHRWSQNHSRIHFGLGSNTTINEIRIEWPSGNINTFTNIAADALYDLVENGPITPALLDELNPITFSPGEECGQPAYTNTLGPILQVWRICGTDDWRMRVRGGLSRLTQHRDLSAQGSIVGRPAAFRFASSTSTTDIDNFDKSKEGQIDFNLIIKSGQANQKGINFNNAGQTSTCLSFVDDSTDFTSIYLGDTGKRIRLPFDLKTLEPVSSCGPRVDGEPPIDQSTDQGWFIWRENGIWQSRFVAGGTGLRFKGSVESVESEYNVQPISIEESDVLNLNSDKKLDFNLYVAGPYHDGFSVSLLNSTNACATLSAPSGVNIHLGPDRVVMPNSFDLNTLGDCASTPVIDTLGKPTIDRAGDNGIFIWENSDNNWHAEVVSANEPRTIELGVLSQQTLSNVEKINIESNDVFTILPMSLDLTLRVRAPWYDGFNFVEQDQSNTCVSTTNSSMPIYLGPNRVNVGNSINLTTLSSCP